MLCSYDFDKDCFYISSDFVRSLSGALQGKVYKIVATSSKGKDFTLFVEADSVDDAQKKAVACSKNDPVKIVSWNITLYKE